MKIRLGVSAAALTAVMAASASMASPAIGNPAVEHCVQLFAKEVVPADHGLEIRHEDIMASIKPINSTRSRVTLIAKGQKYSKLFGRASCVVDRKGSLIAMYLYPAKPGQPAFGRPRVLARNIDATQPARTAFVDDTKPF